MKLIINLLVIVVIVLVFLIISIIKSQKAWKKKLAILKLQRSGATKADFIKYFLAKGYTKETISFVYQKIQDYLSADDLVLLPEDNFQQVYGIDNDEWSYMLEEWFKEIGKPIPPQSYTEYLNTIYTHVSFDYLMELIDGNTMVDNTPPLPPQDY